MIQRILKKTTPLCFLPSGRLICYQHGDIIVLNGEELCDRFVLFKGFKERFLGRFKLVSRLLRLGVRTAIAIDDMSIVVSSNNYLYEVDIVAKTVSKGYFCGEKKRPLFLSNLNRIRDFDSGLYYGDYLGVLDKVPIAIHRRVAIDKWDKVYEYEAGTINHVHNIIPDPYRNCVWIFTGDFAAAAAIWKATFNFKKVDCFLCGNQKYRGCVAFAVPEGILYATDSPFAENYIYLMNTETSEVKAICPINGSCINGCQWGEYYVFSSTVEGDMFKNKRDFLFSRKRGSGIKDDEVHLYCGNISEGFSEILKESKDRYPYYSFAFGVFKFPGGENHSNTLYYQPVATKFHDLDLMGYKI